MKKAEVRLGGTYRAKVSGRLTEVRIVSESRHGGWDAVNVLTNRTVRIKSAQRLRGEAQHGKARKTPKAARTVPTVATGGTEATTEAPKARRTPRRADGHMSGLDAAAKVLEESGEPMTTRAMFDAMVIKGYWTSEAPTPHNTLYSAILREIQKKGDASRFRKAERGKFALKA